MISYHKWRAVVLFRKTRWLAGALARLRVRTSGFLLAGATKALATIVRGNELGEFNARAHAYDTPSARPASDMETSKMALPQNRQTSDGDWAATDKK